MVRIGSPFVVGRSCPMSGAASKPLFLRICDKLSGLGKRKRGLCPLPIQISSFSEPRVVCIAPSFKRPTINAKPLLHVAHQPISLVSADVPDDAPRIYVLVCGYPLRVGLSVVHSSLHSARIGRSGLSGCMTSHPSAVGW